MASTPMIPPEADIAPMAVGKSVAAITAKVDTKSMGLTEYFFPTVSDTAQKINPAATAIDIVRRLTSDLVCFSSRMIKEFCVSKCQL
jgi:hypothetical protein